ncbi:Thymidylate synthase ThyX [Candidatus Syntrophocurvum alkaliphilum]|uniref:Flavin-dependent thymidylate synthase n=1 Tax=Candidatus Syntrophocurvum alkaliphilum TaxID=2293317 RepID=A0A6I6DLT9_9FIRM|nr:FAD-dependent thymidylate synthase [Candidatus Syntrophocurvum alkaliphilum]QGU00757.1 Thymidylate synthase ThyX [Candidatus Syntrophocurvum alkaliphilum]
MKTQLKVELIEFTPNPEKLVAAAAKLCYASFGVENIMDDLDENKTTNFISMLNSIGHESPIEHVSYTFAISGVSRALLAQITRHRLASYSVRSQRYVNEKQFEYIIPPEIENMPEAKELYIKAMEEDQKTYLKLSELLKNKHKEELIASGVDPIEADKKAEKKGNEDARFILPNACETKMVVTMNARSLNNFFNLRCCSRAQWEIRDLATEMLKLVRKVSPTLFAKSGPPCYAYGKCPEGKMSCGSIKHVKEKFTNLIL